MTDDGPELAPLLEAAIADTGDAIAAHVDRLDALVDLKELAEREHFATVEDLLDGTRDPIERGRRLALCRRATTAPNTNPKE